MYNTEAPRSTEEQGDNALAQMTWICFRTDGDERKKIKFVSTCCCILFESISNIESSQYPSERHFSSHRPNDGNVAKGVDNNKRQK